MDLNHFEIAALEQFCILTDVKVSCLRDLQVLNRDVTKAGFMTEFKENNLLCEKSVFDLIPDAVSFPSEMNVGFLIYSEKGQLVALEGYPYGDEWPEKDDKLIFTDLPIEL